MKELDQLRKKIEERDECDVFGEFIALRLWKLSLFKRTVMMKNVTNMVEDYFINKLANDDPNVRYFFDWL